MDLCEMLNMMKLAEQQYVVVSLVLSVGASCVDADGLFEKEKHAKRPSIKSTGRQRRHCHDRRSPSKTVYPYPLHALLNSVSSVRYSVRVLNVKLSIHQRRILRLRVPPGCTSANGHLPRLRQPVSRNHIRPSRNLHVPSDRASAMFARLQ